MLTRLLRSFLRPYIGQVVIVVILLVAQTIGNLYLPNLNADIINNGVEKGNIRYIRPAAVHPGRGRLRRGDPRRGAGPVAGW